jgi:uncharacterized heparinase superfamily protein
MSLLRTLRTVRHLRTRQIVGQLRNSLRQRLENPSNFAVQRSPEFPGVAWKSVSLFDPPCSLSHHPAERVRAGTLRFIGEARDVGWPPDWRCLDASLLWRDNLHYLEFIWGLPFDDAVHVTDSWMVMHVRGEEPVAWAPYPTSLRLVNLVAYFLGNHRDRTLADPGLRDRLWRSIWMQANWLSRRLEVHLMGHHLLENAVALAVVGACFDGLDAKRWKAIGHDLLHEQLAEQILPDGMHFELSPMYHCRVLYALLLLHATGDVVLQTVVDSPLRRAVPALERVLHDDGEIALFNDSAFEIYPTPNALRAFAATLGIGWVHEELHPGPIQLPDAGYFGWRDGGHSLICDAGPIGPDHIPGHAHADMFSFELTLNGSRVIVDSGNHDYLAGPMRNYCRSTAAHNTVAVEGQDQCELWGAFRVARRGRTHDVVFSTGEQGFELSGWHDGYHRLVGRPTHRRRFTWHSDGLLVIADDMTSDRDVSAVSRLHLHPAVSIDRLQGSEAVLRLPTGACHVRVLSGQDLSIGSGWYCPCFGEKQPQQVLEITARGRQTRFVSVIGTRDAIARHAAAIESW